MLAEISLTCFDVEEQMPGRHEQRQQYSRWSATLTIAQKRGAVMTGNRETKARGRVATLAVAGVCMLCVVVLAAPLRAWAAAGDVDAIVRTLVGRGIEAPFIQLLLQPDGKVVVAGCADPQGNGRDFVLTRYNADLSVDRTFGAGGVTVTSISPDDERVSGLARQSNGKYVVAGTSIIGDLNLGPWFFVLARYNRDGSLDPTFGSAGTVMTALELFSELRGLALQPDDKPVAVGRISKLGGGGDFAVLVRYNPDGSLDTTFGQNGTVRVAFGTGRNSASLLSAAVIQPDGRIVAAGSFSALDGVTFVLARFNADGSQDASFGRNGTATLTVDSGQSNNTGSGFSAVAVQPDGRIVAAGSLSTSAESTFVLARFNADGSLDSTFAGDGTVLAAIDTFNDNARLVLQPDGRIVIAGTLMAPSTMGTMTSIGLLRYNADGRVDGTFGLAGRVRTPIDGPSGGLGGIVLLPDGKLVAAGGGDSRFVLVRYQGDALPAPTPTPTPTATPPATGRSDSGGGCAIAPQRGLFAALLPPLLLLLRHRRNHQGVFRMKTLGLGLLLACVSVPPRALAAGAVGTGIPSSCTEAALDAALAGGGTVTFNCGASPVTITVTSPKTIAKKTSLDGGGLVTLSGGGTSQVFLVTDKHVALTLANITISEAFGPDGGAIVSSGTLTVSNSTFTNNSGGQGGAIFNGGLGGNSFVAGTLNVSNSSFSNNRGSAGNGGGAIGSFGTLTVANSTFSNNTGGAAGAIFTSGVDSMTARVHTFFSSVTGSTFVSNSTPGGLAGGAIANGNTLTVANCTFSNNSSKATALFHGGGAILNLAKLSVTTSTFANNTVPNAGGGAIFNAGRKLSVMSSTFSNNSASTGGALFNADGKLTVANSTLFQNSASTGGAIHNEGRLNVLNSTFANNGSAIENDDAVSGVATIKNTIVATSTSDANCLGPITDKGNNLDSGGGCGFRSSKHSLSNTDPQLDPAGLADNGGPTQTIAVEAGSPAINAGNKACQKRDQRGFVRPGTGSTKCTIGAYEFNSPGPRPQ